MSGAVERVLLPGGFEAGGRWQREAWLRRPSGEDEAFVLELPAGRSQAARVTALLTRMLDRLGPHTPVEPAQVQALTLGDREALLLHLRRITLGERLSCVIKCETCGEPMDLELAVSDLLLPSAGRAEQEVRQRFEVDGRVCWVRFRLPTGADQEEAAALISAGASGADAGSLLLRRCVAEVAEGDDGLPLAPESWPAGLGGALSERFAELDPQAEILLNLACPACGSPSTVPLDAGRFVLAEWEQRSRHLFREVHSLALHYHWSEREILAMPAAKRRIYLDLLSEHLSGEGRP